PIDATAPFAVVRLVRSRAIPSSPTPADRSCPVHRGGTTFPILDRRKPTVIRSTKRTVVAALAVSAVAVLPAGIAPAAAAAEPAAAPAASAAVAEEGLRPLIEMITADKKGRFYTLNAAEAATAERVNGFTRTDESEGISMFNREKEGTIPVHRLRLRSGHQAYLL